VLPRRADGARPGAADVQPRLLSLEQRGLAERLYWATCAKVRDLTRKLDEVPEELEELESILSDIYFCNFLGVPVAARQLGHRPAVPDHAHPPSQRAPDPQGRAGDITCDSDGKIDRFVSQRDVKKTLELHAITAQDEYYLAAFLVGAYQETLGDLHNLFGDTHVVHVRFHDDGGWWIEEVVRATRESRCSSTWNTTSPTSPRPWRGTAERAVRDGPHVGGRVPGHQAFYEGELNGYAYLE
jgi:arginine decarboxylase